MEPPTEATNFGFDNSSYHAHDVSRQDNLEFVMSRIQRI